MRSPIPLCDTNIISELARPVPDAGVLAWADQTATIALSVVSIEEIAFGLAWRPNARIVAWFEQFLHDSCDVLPVTDQVARVCGQMRGHLAAIGQVRTQADMLIAATARVHQLTLVTRNTRDFEDCLIPLLNPFAPANP
jgi:predicted nucleic acid-binding protein